MLYRQLGQTKAVLNQMLGQGAGEKSKEMELSMTDAVGRPVQVSLCYVILRLSIRHGSLRSVGWACVPVLALG